MPQSLYRDLANFLAEGNWESTTDAANWNKADNSGRTATSEQIRTAALIDMMVSLRAIRKVLGCPNVRAMALAAIALDKNVAKALKDLAQDRERAKERAKTERRAATRPRRPVRVPS